MGNKYIRERPLEQIIDKLMTPQEDEDEKKETVEAKVLETESSKGSIGKKNSTASVNRENNRSPEPSREKQGSTLGSKKGSVSQKNATIANTITIDSSAPIEGEDEDAEPKEEPIRFLPNDYLEKAEMTPP